MDGSKQDDEESQEIVISNTSDELSESERGGAGMPQQEPNNKYELTVDEVIEQHIGPRGFAEILHALLVSIPLAFDAQASLVSIFSDAQPPARLVSNHTVVEHSSLCGLSSGEWEWVGGKRSTMVAEWNLICHHKFLVALPSTLFFIGSLFAFMISFSPNIWVYAFLRFANGFFRSGIGSSCVVLATEVVGRKWRGQAGQYGFFFFALGFLSLPLVAYAERKSWRKLYRTMSYLPLGYSLLMLPFTFESPRWLLVKGRKKEAMEVLKKLARLNGKKLPADLCLVDPFPERDDKRSSEKLWKTKWAVKRVVMVMIAGFGTGFVFYGIQLNSENLDFNLYISVSVNALMEFLAVFMGTFLLGILNRRPLFSSLSYVVGTSCILCGVFCRHVAIAKLMQLAVEAVGFMASDMACNVLYIYCIELFPTNVRNFAVSLVRQASVCFGCVCGAMAGRTGKRNPIISFMVFGIVSVVSGVATLWLRETRKTPLY